MSKACRTCAVYRSYGFPPGVVLIDPAPQGAGDFPEGRAAACPDCGVFPSDLEAINALRRAKTRPIFKADPFALVGGGYESEVTQSFTVAVEVPVQLTLPPGGSIPDLDALRLALFDGWMAELDRATADTLAHMPEGATEADAARGMAAYIRIVGVQPPRTGGPRRPPGKPVLRCPGERDYALVDGWMRDVPAFELTGNNWFAHVRAIVNGQPTRYDWWDAGGVGTYFRVPVGTNVGDIVKGAAVPGTIARDDPARHKFSRFYVVTALSQSAIRLAPAADLSQAQAIRGRALASAPAPAPARRGRIVE